MPFCELFFFNYKNNTNSLMLFLFDNKEKKFNLFALFLIVIAGIAAYSNSFHCAFIFDDNPNITENLRIRNLWDIHSWWSFNPRRPIGFLTFALNYHFNELNVWGYHLVNLLIHLTNGLLVYWLIKQTFQTPAIKGKYDSKIQMMIPLFAALLFVVHPIMSEAVTYIVQRLVSLATLFYLLSLNMYIKGRLSDKPFKKNVIFYILSVFAAILGLLTKEIAYTLVAALLLYEIYFFNSSLKHKNKKWMYLILLIFLVSIVFFSFTVKYDKFFKVIEPTEGNNYSITTYTYLLTEFRVLITYIRLLVVPISQTFDYDYPLSKGFFEIKTMGSFLIITSIIDLAIWLRKKNKWISFGIIWFFITISVQSSIIARPNVIFEHRVYLSMVGYLFVIIGIFLYLDKFKEIRTVLLAIAIVLISVFGVYTYQRNKIWANTYTFWADAVKKSSNKPRPLNNFGSVLIEYGDYENALLLLNKAIVINPKHADYYNNRGVAKFYLKDTSGALDDFNKAIFMKVNSAKTYYNRANIMADQKKYKEAIEDYTKAIFYKPDYLDAIKKRKAIENILSIK